MFALISSSSNQYHTGQIKGQSVMVNTRILESISMLRTFLVIFLGRGAGVEGVTVVCINFFKVCRFDALIFICVSFCISSSVLRSTIRLIIFLFYLFQTKQ